MRNIRFAIPAIVIGGGITALAAIRAMGRAGIPVYCISQCKDEATCSSYCRKSFVAPDIYDQDHLKNILKKFSFEKKGAILFPVSDAIALNLANLKDELDTYILTIPKKDVLDKLINKNKFYESLKKENVSHPHTLNIENRIPTRKILKNITYPVYVRPHISHEFWKIFQRKGFVAESEKKLLNYLNLTHSKELEVMIQEIVPGPPTNHVFIDGYMDKKSDPKVVFARQRLRMWPLTFGNSTFCRSIPIDQVNAQHKTLIKYLKAINYSGLFSAEFKKDERDCVVKLLEINFRTSAWFSALSASCGVNIMKIAYLDSIGEEVKIYESYRRDFKWLELETDLRASARMISTGDLSIPVWLSVFLQCNQECFPIAKDDIGPFIVYLKRFFPYLN